jgi:hypothetical protein
MTIKEKLLLFANELFSITDDNLREFAARLIINAPEYFFTIPASSSGKYHPCFAREEGGLVKHTRCVVFYAICNSESFDFTQNEKDLLIIAAIAHDINKQGSADFERKTAHTLWKHPELASEYVLQMQTKYPQLISIENAKQIANAILCHMGKWAHHPEFVKNKKQFPMPNNLFENALQSADYIASRTELTGFDFKGTDKLIDKITKLSKTVNYEENKETISPGDYLITFGKYKGSTIKEIYLKDDEYITWVFNCRDFSNKKAYEMICEFLKNEKKLIFS